MRARPLARFFGAPLVPEGDPMLAGVGPGAWAQNRADFPDYTFDDNLPKIVPLRSVPEFFLAWEDPDVIGMDVFGADGRAGRHRGGCLDRPVRGGDPLCRGRAAGRGGGKRVLLPMNFLQIKAKRRSIVVSAILGAQFANVPATKEAQTVTFLEEEKIMAYYGGGLFYARPAVRTPLL